MPKNKNIVCPHCKTKESNELQFDVYSSINGWNIEIKCPNPECNKYTFFTRRR